MKNIFYGWFMLAGLTLMYATTNGVGACALTVMRRLQIKSFGLGPPCWSKFRARELRPKMF